PDLVEEPRRLGGVVQIGADVLRRNGAPHQRAGSAEVSARGEVEALDRQSQSRRILERREGLVVFGGQAALVRDEQRDRDAVLRCRRLAERRERGGRRTRVRAQGAQILAATRTLAQREGAIERGARPRL